MAHELDDPWFKGFGSAIGQSKDGDFFTRCLLENGTVDLSPLKDGRFLGLAAGNANSELRLAQRFGFLPNKVSLLDLSYQDEVTSVGVTKIADGVFEFLERRAKTGFSLVTLVHAEFLADTPYKAETLASLLPGVIVPSGLVCIYPIDNHLLMSNHLPAALNKYGFGLVGHFWYQYPAGQFSR